MFEKSHVCDGNANQKLSLLLKVSVAAPARARAVCKPVQGWGRDGHLLYCRLLFLADFPDYCCYCYFGAVGVIIAVMTVRFVGFLLSRARRLRGAGSRVAVGLSLSQQLRLPPAHGILPPPVPLLGMRSFTVHQLLKMYPRIALGKGQRT